jgi:peptidyl-tRNA hydrolase
LIHAAGESSPGNLPKGTYAVALTVADEAELRELHARLSAACVPHATIIETDGEHAGQMMAIGVAPGDRQLLRRYFSSLPLSGREPREKKEVHTEAA